MASRGTRGPSPQTRHFTGPQAERAQKSQERNIKCERERSEKRERDRRREGEGKKQRERKCLHHEWNRNDAPLGSISEPLHTMAASLTSKLGNNAESPAYYGSEI